MSLLKKITVCAMALALLVPAVAGAVTINELRIDNSGGDTDEYFELAGPAGMSLAGYTYIVIGDGAGGTGTIETAVDLASFAIQADGLFAAHKAGTTPACTGYDAEVTLSFENGDNVTHMLVTGFTGAIGDDIDVDDDGNIDNAPWSTIEDCVGLVSPPDASLLYCDTTVGPDGDFVPAHAFRCGDAWFVGQFGDSPFTCTASLDTPGEPNGPSCSVPTEETSWGAIKSTF